MVFFCLAPAEPSFLTTTGAPVRAESNHTVVSCLADGSVEEKLRLRSMCEEDVLAYLLHLAYQSHTK